MPPGKPKQGSLVANSRKERILANRVTFRTVAVFGKPRELLHNIYYPGARRAVAAASRARPGPASADRRRPPRWPAAAAAPLPGSSGKNTVETKAERSPCCNSRGPGREKVPDRECRAQRRAGLEVDKILRPFHSHIKQLLFFSFFKKSVQQNKLRRNRERCLDSGVKETPSFPHIRLWFV